MDYSEDRLQQIVMMWFRNKYLPFQKLLFSVPNGGKRDGREMKFLKSTGLTEGVADLILMAGGTSYNIELKRYKKYNHSPEQKIYESMILKTGGNYVVFNELLPILNYIESIMDKLLTDKQKQLCQT